MLTYITLQDRPREFLAATGLTHAECVRLLPVFTAAYAAFSPSDQTWQGKVRQRQQFPFMTDRLSMTYENGERSGPIDPLFAPEGASYRLSNDRMRYDPQAQWAMETELSLQAGMMRPG